MKTKVITALVLVLFAGLAIWSYTTQQNKLQLQNVELKSRETKIKALDLKYNKLNTELDKLKSDKNASEEKVKQLEAERQKLESEKNDISRQLQAKLEQKSRLAQASAQVVNTVTNTKVASAAPAGCENLRGIFAANGIAEADMSYALAIAQKESTCGVNMVNPNGGACGYFQELPCGKWGGVANLAGHIRGADNYAKTRYGSWAGAWNAWQSKHWW